MNRSQVRRRPAIFAALGLVATRFAAAGLLAAGLVANLPACRTAYGIDPTTEPEKAARTPGLWDAELKGGMMGPNDFERYHVEFDGEHAWVVAVRNVGGSYRRWQRALTPAEFTAFALQSLSVDPFEWCDRRARGPGSFETLRLRFRAGDRARSVMIEGPALAEIVFLDRFREIAGLPPAPVAASTK